MGVRETGVVSSEGVETGAQGDGVPEHQRGSREPPRGVASKVAPRGLRLRQHLVISQALIMILTLLVFPLAVYAISRLAQRTDALVSENVQAIDAVHRIRVELGNEGTALMNVPPGARPGADVARSAAAVRAAIDGARRFVSEPSWPAELADFEQRYTLLENANAEWRDGRAQAPPIAALTENLDALRLAAVRLEQFQTDALHTAASSARDFAQTLLVVLVTLGLFAFLLGLLATRRVVGSITRPVHRLNELTRRIRSGDFDIVARPGRIEEFNHLERHFEAMSMALRKFRATNLERLFIEQRRIDAVLESIGDGLVIFSEDGRIERINAVAGRQLGTEPGTAVGRAFDEIGDTKIGERVREILAGGGAGIGIEPEFTVERDGERRVLAFGIHRFVERQSSVPGVVMVLRDVTTQREFDKMRSEFVMHASHELRTPITSIRMGLSLLGEKMNFAPGSRDEELFRTVEQELARMVTLLGDLLDLSRLRAGVQTMDRLPVALDDVFSGVRHRFAPAAAAKHIELDLAVETGLPHLSLCRSAFDRVLDNLVNNAMRCTPDRGSIELRAHREDDNVVIDVADSGPGIPYAQQVLVFQPFVQIGNRRGGAGLGLAICKEIVQQHGGDIRVTSLPKRGTTFSIVLPV
jgi:NtrC-family two-component system sensor histidine kinase KinB